MDDRYSDGDTFGGVGNRGLATSMWNSGSQAGDGHTSKRHSEEKGGSGDPPGRGLVGSHLPGRFPIGQLGTPGSRNVAASPHATSHLRLVSVNAASG